MFIIPVGNNIEKRDVPFVTIGLIAVNVLVFLLQLSQFVDAGSREAGLESDSEFFHQFGLIPSELAEFQVLGLITYMFVHAGVFHLLGNMFMLYVFGPAIEYGMGRLTMLGFYGFFGIVGGIAHACFDLGSTIPLVGASGAIAGLIGAYTVVYGPASRIRMMAVFFFHPFFFSIPAALFGAGWMLMQLMSASADGADGGVAWWAHIGGFAVGAVMAWICRSEVGELVQGSGDQVRLLSAEEVEKEAAMAAEMEQRKADGLSGIVIPLQEEELAPPPSACEHCNAELQEEDQISEQLFRCSQCERMVYLSVQQAEALAMAKS